MFNFVTVPLELEEPIVIQKEGERYYKFPSAEAEYPSVTTVTGIRSRKSIAEWRKRVGEDQANRISTRATSRGNAFHAIIEEYLRGTLNEQNYSKDPLALQLFKVAKTTLDKIENIHALETPLFSHLFGLAGRVDCIAEYDGELAVIDFKTSKKPKPREWIDHYFVQCAAYACMLYEMTGIMVKKFIIIMSCENGECVVYEEYNKRKYINLLSEYIREFVEYKLQEYA